MGSGEGCRVLTSIQKAAQFWSCKWLQWPHLTFFGPAFTSKVKPASFRKPGVHGCLARGGAGETFWAPDPRCVGGPRICVSCLSLSIQRSQLHSCCPAVRRGSQAHSQATVLRVVWTWSRGEEDPGTWAKDWMGTCSWNWLVPDWRLPGAPALLPAPVLPSLVQSGVAVHPGCTHCVSACSCTGCSPKLRQGPPSPKPGMSHLPQQPGHQLPLRQGRNSSGSQRWPWPLLPWDVESGSLRSSLTLRFLPDNLLSRAPLLLEG